MHKHIKNTLSIMLTSPFIKPYINAAIPMNNTWYPVVALADDAFIGLVSKKLIMHEPDPTPKIPWDRPAKKPPNTINLNYFPWLRSISWGMFNLSYVSNFLHKYWEINLRYAPVKSTKMKSPSEYFQSQWWNLRKGNFPCTRKTMN